MSNNCIDILTVRNKTSGEVLSIGDNTNIGKLEALGDVGVMINNGKRDIWYTYGSVRLTNKPKLPELPKPPGIYGSRLP